MPRPIGMWVAQILAGTSVAAGSDTTITVNLTGDWEVHLPIKVQFSRVSADLLIRAYKTDDGGANFDTVPTTFLSIARIAQGNAQGTMVLSTGMYVVRLSAYTSQDAVTFYVPTYFLITAIS